MRTRVFCAGARRWRDHTIPVIQGIHDFSTASQIHLNPITLSGFYQNPPTSEQVRAKFESPFEEAIYDWLTFRGYRVTPQVKVGNYRIDLVVEGINSRLAVECDGDRWHPIDQWSSDRLRQRQIERAGWKFWRVWGSAFYGDPDAAMRNILPLLEELDIKPRSSAPASHADGGKEPLRN